MEYDNQYQGVDPQGPPPPQQWQSQPPTAAYQQQPQNFQLQPGPQQFPQGQPPQQWQSQPPSGYQQQQQQPPYQQPPGQSYQSQAPQPGQALPPGQPTDDEGPSYQWDDAPAEDVDDDENLTEPAVVLPTDISGGYNEGDYTNTNYNAGAPVPPPSYDEATQPSERPAEQFSGAANLSEEDVRDAMLQYVSENCCYGSKPAKDMTIHKIIPSSALHYQLESFCESRTTKREFEPYHGQQVDGPMYGQPPPVWTIECHPDGMFSDHIKGVRVPHTEHVSGCHTCSSRGFVRCWRCHGRGRVRCSRCHGRGRISHRTKNGTRTRNCSSCIRGRRRCYTCGGDGRITCGTCKGLRSLLHFIQLYITYKTHVDDYILEKSDLPDALIRDVNGQVIFTQEAPAVWPITSYPVPDICGNSQRLINTHRQKYQSEKQLRQKHWLRSVPVSEVHYNYKDVNTRFWAYGFEKKVFAPDYPAQCCWGCNII